MAASAPHSMDKPPPPKPASSGVVVPRPLVWHQRLAAFFIYLVVRAVAQTIRYEWCDTTGLLHQDVHQPVIFCTWHNRLALCLEVYRLYMRRIGREPRMAAMVSASRDGGLLARILEHYQVQPVRGSTSRRGRQALLELTTWAERGYDLGITPDGPRGPCYLVQDGVTSLAQLTGLPIVPVIYEMRWKIRLGSWDRFQIPFPFSRCLLRTAAPLHIPREATDAEREQMRTRLEELLKNITVD